MSSQFENPSEEFVRFFFSATNYGSRFTATAREQFTEFVKKAASQFINESVSDFLDSVKAVQNEDEKTEENDKNKEKEHKANGIVTTDEELDGFQIVRAIICQIVSPDRIFHRDTKSYFGILLDDTNRKPLCRLHFNTNQKYIGIFDGNKTETRHQLDEITDIYNYTEQLIETVNLYEK